MTVYVAGAALDRLDRAQVDIDQHVHTRFGVCTTCRQPAPCGQRLAASALFARYGRLPRRRPGLALSGNR